MLIRVLMNVNELVMVMTMAMAPNDSLVPINLLFKHCLMCFPTFEVKCANIHPVCNVSIYPEEGGVSSSKIIL